MLDSLLNDKKSERAISGEVITGFGLIPCRLGSDSFSSIAQPEI